MWYFTVHKISERVLIASSLGNMSPHITWDLKQNWGMEQAFKNWFCLGSYQHVCCVQCRHGVFHVGLELMHNWREKSSFVMEIVSNKIFVCFFWQTLQLLGWWWSCYYLLQVITSGRKSWVWKIPTSVRPITGCTHSHTCSQWDSLAKETSEDQRLSKGRYEDVLSV